MEWWAWMLITIAIVLICSGVCEGGRRYHNRGVILHPAPVIVTSTTHTTAASGPYPVTVAVPAATVQHTASQYQPGVYPMPQPQSGYPAQYPPASQAHSAPYPATSGAGAMPMPGGTGMNPPSYDQVVGNDAYQKQAPYNPSYGGGN